MAGELRSDWQAWLNLEYNSHRDRDAREVRDLVNWMQFLAIRIMYMLFERYNFDPRASEPLEFYRALVDQIPDERIVEEIHGDLRGAEDENKNMVVSRIRRQQIATHSGKLESRNIPHKILTKDEFIAQDYLEPGTNMKNIGSA